MAAPQRVTGDNLEASSSNYTESMGNFHQAANTNQSPTRAINHSQQPAARNSPQFYNLQKITRPNKEHQEKKEDRSHQKQRIGQRAAGTGMQVVGKATDVAGKGVSAAGKGATRAGATLSATGVGAIVGVPLIAVGGAATAAGRGTSAVGKGIDKSGRDISRRAKSANRREQFIRRRKKTVSNNLKQVALLEIWAWTGFVYLTFILPIALFTNFALFAYWVYLYATDSMIGGLLDTILGWFFDFSGISYVFLFAFFACYLLLAAIHYISLALIYINCRALLIHPLSGGGHSLKVFGFFVAAIFIWVPIVNVFPLYWVWLSQIQLSPK